MKTLTVFLFLISTFYAAGQSLEPTNRKLSEAADSAASLYFASQHESLAIHNGRVFYGYPGMLGHAFYPETGWQNGSLLYDGIWYHNVALMYDTHREEVLILHPRYIAIRLFSERVQQFYFRGFQFFRLHPDKDNVLKSGIYQRLAKGNVTIFVRRQKRIDEKITDMAIERKFVPVNEYYVLKDGRYHKINKQQSLLGLLKDNRQNIVQHLRQQKLKYKKNKEQAIIRIAEFYNQSHK